MGKQRDERRAAQLRRAEFEKRVEEDSRHSGHGRPKTRREFLGRGLIAGVSTVFLPSIATIFAREVYAQTGCVIDNGAGALGAGKIPFLAFDQGGGANIAGSNIMVGKMGGQEVFLDVAGYGKLGLPAALAPQTVGVDRTFGLAMHPRSALLRGMLSKTTAATRANVNGVVIPARSENDTSNNPHNPVYGIARAGANGEFVATIGSENTASGGNSAAPASMISADLRPTKVSNRTEAIGLIGGGAQSTFPSGKVAQAAAAISALKLGKITEQQAAKDLVQCGYDKTTAALNTMVTAQDLDPNLDPVIQSIFPGAELTSGDFRKAAAAMKVVINGYGGAGTIQYGGRDYHQNPRPDTDTKDFIVGQAIGASLEYAAQKSKPLMIYLFSDGSVSSDQKTTEDDGQGNAKFRWTSDDSQTAASAIFVFSPNGRPVLRTAASEQLGYFRANGSIETASTPFANSVTQLAEMVVLNYLALHGEEAMFNTVLTNPGLGTAAAAAPYIAFNRIV